MLADGDLTGCSNDSEGMVRVMDDVLPTLEKPTTRDDCSAVFPMPVIDWKAVVLAENPTRVATRERLRQLHKKSFVSDGVSVTKRGQRGLEGSGKYFSVLAALAAKSRHEGNTADAERLLSAANKLERRFALRLSKYLATCPLDSLPEADFFHDLVAATAENVSWWTRHSHTLVAVAKVADSVTDLAHLAGLSANGEPVDVDVPTTLLERQGLGVGDHVWVFSRILESAALVDVLRAVLVPCVQVGSLGGALAVAWQRNLTDIEDDGLTNDERAVYAERWRSGVGADLNAEDVADLRADARNGSLPVRRLRPAG
jgi:hypothetical protein